MCFSRCFFNYFFKNIFLIFSLIFCLYFLINLLLLLPYFLPAGDDLFGAKQLAEKQFWDMNRFVFMSWDARYTATFLSSLFFYFGGLKHYWLSGVLLLFTSFAAYYFLLLKLIPSQLNYSGLYRYVRIFIATFLFLIAYLIIAKPGAIGGAQFVLVGQFFYSAGAYCYQTSIIFTVLILGCLINLNKYLNKNLNFKKLKIKKLKITGLVIIILFLLFLLAGTNEGTAIMMALVLIYGVYQSAKSASAKSGNNLKLNLFLVFLFTLLVLMVVVIQSPGDQNRMLYYQLKSDEIPGTHDFVLSFGLAIWQSFFLIFYFVLNPLSWLLVSLISPELKMFRKFRKNLAPSEDYFLITLGLIFVGFFLVAWTMGRLAPPRYYGVMATLGFFISLDFLIGFWEFLELKILKINGLKKLLKNKNYVLNIFQIFCIVILIIFNTQLIPLISNVHQARLTAQEFDRVYFSIVHDLKQAQKLGKKQIILKPDQVFPTAPILDYFIAYQKSLVPHKLTDVQRRDALAKDLAVYYGVDTVLLEQVGPAGSSLITIHSLGLGRH